jgi:hypothetical protein
MFSDGERPVNSFKFSVPRRSKGAASDGGTDADAEGEGKAEADADAETGGGEADA